MDLLDFPVELLVSILMALDWEDLLKIRKTCKALQSASKERPVWLNLFMQTLGSPLVGFRLDYPIQMYTSHELERYTLRYISSNMVYKNRDLAGVHRRGIPFTEKGHFYLSQSGRWLLVLYETGMVDYYDLDNPYFSAQPLIPGLSSTRNQEVYMVADVDPTEPKLTFNLALYTGCDHDPRTSFFQIWRVQLNIDPIVKQPYLTAAKLASFHRDTRGYFCDMSLLGDILAYSISGVANFSEAFDPPASVIIIEWRGVLESMPNGTSLGSFNQTIGYSKRISYPEYGSVDPQIRLLPDSRIFVVSEYTAQLFRYNQIRKTNGMPHAEISERTPCAWAVQLDEFWYRLSTLSPAFLCRSTNTIKLVVKCYQSVAGFVIPLTDNEDTASGTGEGGGGGGGGGADPPRYSTLVGPMGFDRASSFGLHTGMTFNEINGKMGPALAIGYSWPDESDQDGNSQSETGETQLQTQAQAQAQGRVLRRYVLNDESWNNFPSQFVFNEFTGRGVVVYPGHRRFISVLNFSLVV